MKQNLDSLRNEIESYVTETGFLMFRGFSRAAGNLPEVEWDTHRYPDYRAYLAVAKELGVRVVVVHHREFPAGLIDDAIDDLETGYALDEDGSIRRRLNEIRMYEGFTCAVELSFEHGGIIYFWELHAPWYDEFQDLRDELDMFSDSEETEEDEDDESLGGYYSKN